MKFKYTTYLCGGINGLSDSECRDWRNTAKSLLLTDTLDPMRRDYRGREDEFSDEIVEYDLGDIDKSEFVLVNATKPSWGTAMEVFYANRICRVVIGFTGDSPISPWLKYHCELYANLEAAIEEINGRVRHGLA